MLTLIGLGNRWRGDDAAGLLVAERLGERAPAGVEVRVHEREPLELLSELDGTPALWLIDAIRCDRRRAGVLLRFDASEEPLPASLFGVSTHDIGLADTLELARSLGRLPKQVIVHGIVGARFDVGERPSPAVARAVRTLARTLVHELRQPVAAAGGGC